MPPMILTLRITKINPGHYRAEVLNGGEELGESDVPAQRALIKRATSALSDFPITHAL